jgi:excisionase family DNA binding protein
MTTKQAAAVLGIAARTVKDYCYDGKLKAAKVGRDWLIAEQDLEQFKASRRPRGRPRVLQSK